MVESRRIPSATSTTSQRAAIACQTCRSRKVKCDAQSAPLDQGCTPCRRAGQECIFDPLSDGRRRSVNPKLVDKLQQRIESLEALNQRSLDRSAWRPNEHELDAPSLPDAPVRPPSPSVAQRETARPLHSTGTPVPALPASPRTVRSDSPTFYGATSHLHVASPSDGSRVTSSDYVDTVGIELDAHSPRLRDQLIRSFFKYQTLWVDIVNKDSFLSHRATGTDCRWYSKFLENAMLACGTRLSTSASVRALGSKYCEWTKESSLRALYEPTPANLQGFLLLSEYEVTQGNARPGWMFCGMACRMLSDLGLHELASLSGPCRMSEDAAKESDLAYSLLSACVVYEGVWTLYLGRPSSIPASFVNTAAARSRMKHTSDSPWLNAWVGLCVPMAQVSHVLNEQSISDLERADSLRKLLRQMEEWYEDLPPEMKYDENGLTDMDLEGYGLHTQYCKVQILLRQALAGPHNSRKRRFSQIATGPSLQTSVDETQAIIYQYALRTARLVIVYREAFGTEKIPSIMLDNAVVAATTMIQHLNDAGKIQEMKDQVSWLRQLVKSMELVQMHFPIIGRMLDSLKQICGTGPLGSMLSPQHRGPADAISQYPRTLSQSFDLGPLPSNVQEDSLAFGFDPDVLWDFFDTNAVPDLLSSNKAGDSLLGLAGTGTAISNFPQVVP